MSVNILFKNKPFSNVRFIYDRLAFPSGTPVDQTYADGSGNRYYYSIVNNNDEFQMEAAEFSSFISFTMSGNVTHFINAVPMEPGELIYFNIDVTGTNLAVDKGFVSNSRKGFIHDGTDILPIGGTAGMTFNSDNDFTSSVAAGYIINASASVAIAVSCDTGETIDWNLFIRYSKCYNAISNPTPPLPGPIYPIS
jgi:hypothetical protein